MYVSGEIEEKFAVSCFTLGAHFMVNEKGCTCPKLKGRLLEKKNSTCRSKNRNYQR